MGHSSTQQVMEKTIEEWQNTINESTPVNEPKYHRWTFQVPSITKMIYLVSRLGIEELEVVMLSSYTEKYFMGTVTMEKPSTVAEIKAAAGGKWVPDNQSAELSNGGTKSSESDQEDVEVITTRKASRCSSQNASKEQKVGSTPASGTSVQTSSRGEKRERSKDATTDSSSLPKSSNGEPVAKKSKVSPLDPEVQKEVDAITKQVMKDSKKEARVHRPKSSEDMRWETNEGDQDQSSSNSPQSKRKKVTKTEILLQETQSSEFDE